MNNFNELNISRLLTEATEKMNYQEMTEVQSLVIPLALTNVDLIAQAPTGTGKTMAFAIPILNKIDSTLEQVQAIIISPTRELALQITTNFKEAAYYMDDVKIVCVYGGEPIDVQIRALKRKPQIVVATPGRLIDHLHRRTVKLDYVNTVVLDEADEMLNMGFKEDLDEILDSVRETHQTMLFSATISKEIERIASKYLNNPETVKVTKNELTVSTIDQKYIDVEERDKVEVITRLIDVYGYKLVMIFCNTKRMVDEVTASLMVRGFVAEGLHGDMKQNQRDRVMQRFKNGTVGILVASDVAARGLDIDNVDAVINYDVPNDDEYYVHRVGRTGRANKEGISITLVNGDEKHRLREIMQYSKAMITKMNIPNLDNVVKARLERVANVALEKASKKNKFATILDEYLEGLDEEISLSLLQGLLLMQIGELNDLSENSRKINRKKDKVRLFIGTGRNDGIKIGAFLDLIANAGGISHNDIDDVVLRDAFSFCEVPSSAVDKITYFFATNKVKGRTIGVEPAKERTGGSSRSRSSDHSGSRSSGSSRSSSSRGGYRGNSSSHSRQSSDSSFKKNSSGYVEINVKDYYNSRKKRDK